MAHRALQCFILVLHWADVGGDCLPDAIPRAQRKNLTLEANTLPGTDAAWMQSYPRPVDLFVPDWTAAKATAAVIEILIQERLGYLLLQSSSNGSTTADALYALAGCLNESDLMEKSCDETSNSHVSLGWTELYPSIWDLLQESNAPRNLGNIGYFVTRSIYLPSEVQKEAYGSTGLPLDFYLSYNVSVHNPTSYFDQVSVGSGTLTSRLKFCNQTRLMSNTLMQTYLQVTGDTGGIESSNGIVTGQCFQEFFWLSPSCRDGTVSCIMLFTGGDGWDMENSMQKSTAWNMPIRIAVAKTDQDYAALPTETSSLFYWWVPDQTFLALEPVEVLFPRHDAGAYRKGDLRSGPKQISVDKYVSHELQGLAPSIVQLVEAFQMDLQTVNALLDDQRRTEVTDSFHSVACRWLKGNTPIWQSWMPKASTCLAGFGVYNRPRSRFVLSSELMMEGNECRACEAGSYSSRYRDDNISTFLCKPCAQGTAQEMQGSLSCQLCMQGTYQNQSGLTSCTRCETGRYQDAKGQTTCKECMSGTTSIGLGAQSVEECGCHEGTMKTQDKIGCVPCIKGIDCPWGSSLDALLSGSSPFGDRFVPKISPGYQSNREKPLSVYKCRKQWHCPGEVPGQCSAGRSEIACAQCPAGETWLRARCNACDIGVVTAWIVGLCLGLMIVSGSYYVVSKHISGKASLSESIGMILLVVLNACQCLAIIGFVDVSWPPHVEVVFSFFQIFVFDLDYYGLRCIVGSGTFGNYLMTVALVPMAQCWLLICCWLSSWLPARWQWSWPRVSSTMGSLLLSAFSTTSVVAMTPFLCYSHPNGEQSLLKYPESLCNENGAMQTTGLAMLTLYVAGFLAVCLYAVCALPSWMNQRRREMVLCFRFLIFRLRVDSWWFEVIWVTRGPFLAFCIMLLPDATIMQIHVLCMGLVAYLLLETYMWPWKVPIMNVFDQLVSTCLLFLVIASPYHAQREPQETSNIIMGLFGTMIGMLALLILFVIAHRGVLSENNVFFNLGYVDQPHEFRLKLQCFSHEIQQLSNSRIERIVGHMSVHDLRQLSAGVDLLVAEVMAERPLEEAVRNRRMSANLLSRSQTRSIEGAISPIAIEDVLMSAGIHEIEGYHEASVELQPDPVGSIDGQGPDEELREDVASTSDGGKGHEADLEQEDLTSNNDRGKDRRRLVSIIL